LRGLAVPIRLGLRELRGGLRGFGVFLACLALGVATIAGVGSLARGLGEGLARNGQALLGGDLAFDLLHREASPEERDYIGSLGQVSTVSTMRAMARLPDGSDQTLIELKGVDDSYPLYGKMALQDGAALAPALAMQDGVVGAVAEETLLVRLGIQKGARVLVGRDSRSDRARAGPNRRKLRIRSALDDCA
jgi:putative ABC transport system permease protein